MTPTDREVQSAQKPTSVEKQTSSELVLHEMGEILKVLRESHELVGDINEDLFGKRQDESPEIVSEHQGISAFFPRATDGVMDIKRWSTRIRQALRDLEESI